MEDEPKGEMELAKGFSSSSELRNEDDWRVGFGMEAWRSLARSSSCSMVASVGWMEDERWL